MAKVIQYGVKNRYLSSLQNSDSNNYDDIDRYTPVAYNGDYDGKRLIRSTNNSADIANKIPATSTALLIPYKFGRKVVVKLDEDLFKGMRRYSMNTTRHTVHDIRIMPEERFTPISAGNLYQFFEYEDQVYTDVYIGSEIIPSGSGVKEDYYGVTLEYVLYPVGCKPYVTDASGVRNESVLGTISTSGEYGLLLILDTITEAGSEEIDGVTQIQVEVIDV